MLFIPACGVWENFTTYFNLYYNTTDAFEQAEEAISLEERSIFSTKEITVPGSANQLLNRVIEKTSKILQFHGTTSYVDDALLMLGKSFYYQKNYLKSIRKFQELTATQKESDLYLEAELWIAKTEMRLKNYETALLLLDSVRIKAAGEGEDEIIEEAYIEEVIYNVTIENYAQAIKIADELLNIVDDDARAAEVAFETASFYTKLEDPKNALRYLEMVSDYSPVYKIELDALVERGRTLRQLDRNEEALDIFETMRLEDKYKDNFDVIDYEIGMTYEALGETDRAVENLVYVDTSYTTSVYSGIARYNLGRIYEDKLVNFDSAAVYYQKAAASQLPTERVKEVHARNLLFTKYGDLTARLMNNRKQLMYLDDPQTFARDSIIYYDSVKVLAALDSLETGITGGEELRTGRTGREQQQQIPRETRVKQFSPPIKPTIPRDSIIAGINKDKFDLANLFFAELAKPDSAAKYYNEILNDSSAAVYYSRTLYALGNYYQAAGDSAKADSIFNYIYDNYKNDRVVNAAAARLNKPLINITYDPAEDIYSEAEKYWLAERFDSSLTLYREVYTEYPKSNYAPKAWLASGWILENDLNMPDSAASVYDSISVKFPGTPYAQKIGPKLIAYKQMQAQRQREIEDSLRVLNQQADSLGGDTPVVSPDSLTEVERLRLEMQKGIQDTTKTEISGEDTLKVEEIKPDTLQPTIPQDNQNNQRRNPRRRR